MQSDEPFESFKMGYKDFSQANLAKSELIEIQPVENNLAQAKSNHYLDPPGSLFIFFTLFAGIITWCWYADSREIPQERKEVLENYSPSPCRSCRFFSNNAYLLCAVHPSTALTKQALDCPDHCP